MPAAAAATVNTFDSVGKIWSSINTSIQYMLSQINRIIATVIRSFISFIYILLSKLWKQIILPIAMSGINILGFFVDKFLFGCPALRRYFEHGLIASNIQPRWRVWVATNLGWDIYNSMSGIPSNIFGFLGLGIGVLTFLTHLVTSIYYNIRNYYHVLGENGILGKSTRLTDRRNSIVKHVFGCFTSFIVLPVIFITNMVDVIGTGIKHFIKHCGLSIWNNLKVSYNVVLGRHGVYADRADFDDARHPGLIIAFGIITSLIVGIAAFFSNVIDIICTPIKHFFLSCWRNLRSLDNIILGEHGIYGERYPYKDDRSWFVKIPFGLLSAIVVLPIAAASNMFDLACTGIKHFIKHCGLSIWNNLKVSYNVVLGRHGVYGDRADFDDERRLSVMIAFGIITSLIVGIAAFFSNVIDIICTPIKHFFLSCWRNLRSLDNIILGEHGIYGERYPYKDDRSWFIKIPFGLLSAIVVLPIAAASNMFDLACTGIKHFIKHCGLSIWNNLKVSYNVVLGRHGIYADRADFDDQRNLAFLIGFGIFTSPVVGIAAFFSNVIDLICTPIKHFAQSCWYNLKYSYNFILPYHGILKNYSYDDERRFLPKLVFGALSFPIVFVAALLTNIINLIGAYFKHWQQTIKLPALVGTGIAACTLLAIPVFMVRKTLKGLYNATICLVLDSCVGNPLNLPRAGRGLLTALSLGGFSAGFKVYKACTGYSHRFGFIGQHRQHYKPHSKLNVRDYYMESQEKFRDAINLAATGKLTNVSDDFGLFRPILRTFFGIRHRSEKLLIEIHDAYQEYVRLLRKDDEANEFETYSLATFFSNSKFTSIRDKYAKQVDKQELWNEVEAVINPPKPKM